MKTPTALVLFFCAGSATPEVTERPLLKFHGNVAFDEVVYRSTLDLPENARATTAEALALSAKLLGFLPGWAVELHILIATSPWSRGFSPEISTGSPEGLGVGGQYREQDFLVPDDRWELRARVAGALREHLDSNSSRAVLTRVFA